MSGGSQHNPNGRQAQLGAGWSPLQLQVANFLARAPQAHMAERGVTWHTPTPPPHLYHVPAPSPPDALQAVKASGNSVFRHTATPPDLYRHTPTPPDKHLIRHTPSPGDVKTGAAIPPAELYPHLGQPRDKIRPEDLLAYARGVDLSVGGARSANGAPPAAHVAPVPAAHAAPPAHGGTPPALAPALSVRDAPTINSLIARAQPRAGHARVDSLLERLSAPASPHSVIVHSRAAASPSPPSSNEDSTDSCGAPPGSKRKRKPERTIRVPAVLHPASALTTHNPSPHAPSPTDHSPPVENGDTHHTHNGPKHNHPETQTSTSNTKTPPQDSNHPITSELYSDLKPEPQILKIPQKPPSPVQPEPHTRRKTRSNSAETIDDIAAMIASNKPVGTPEKISDPEPETPVSIDKIKSILSSETPESQPEKEKSEEPEQPPQLPIAEEKPKEAPIETKKETIVVAAAPKRRSARTSNAESTNVPVESPSEAKPAEQETSETRSAEPTAASFVEVEKQLENMFAGLEEQAPVEKDSEETNKPKKRRKSAPTKDTAKAGRRVNRASTGDRRKGGKKKGMGKPKKQKEAVVKDAYDSGSNASSSRSRGPYIQIRGPRDSPLSVSVINASTGEDESEASSSRRKRPDEYRNGLRARGLHASTLGLRYDATTPDATWLCAFCERGPHAAGLGDLFGPYTVDTDCEEYRALDEATRRRYEAAPSPNEVWFHESCGVWAPGLVAAGARLWGLATAVWTARGAKCAACAKAGAGIACSRHGCRARTHVPCANTSHWVLDEDEFKATCPRHA